MLKVAFFADILIDHYDGAARTMFQLIDRINRDKYAFFFIYGKGPEQFRTYASYRVPSVTLPFNADYSIALPQLVRHSLYQALDTFAPEVIHIASPSPLGHFAAQYAKKRNIPIITIYHTHFISYIPYYLRLLPLLIKPSQECVRALMRNFYNSCERIFTPTKLIAQSLTEMGIDAGRQSIWGRGVNLSLFNPQKKDPTLFPRLTQNNRPTLLFASRLVWEKNLHTLIAIYQLLQQEQLPYNIVVVGDGSAREELHKQMPKALFLGALNHEDLAVHYASADVFIFTSTSETYGNVVVEAMASGLPCVLANGGGSSTLVEHGHTGWKCTPNSAKEYVHYLEKILQQPALKAQVIEQALQQVQSLDWDHLAAVYFEEISFMATQHYTPAYPWATY